MKRYTTRYQWRSRYLGFNCAPWCVSCASVAAFSYPVNGQAIHVCGDCRAAAMQRAA